MKGAYGHGGAVELEDVDVVEALVVVPDDWLCGLPEFDGAASPEEMALKQASDSEEVLQLVLV
jgi:hypothetical protein